jgi:hypothetical protein
LTTIPIRGAVSRAVSVVLLTISPPKEMRCSHSPLGFSLPLSFDLFRLTDERYLVHGIYKVRDPNAPGFSGSYLAQEIRADSDGFWIPA